MAAGVGTGDDLYWIGLKAVCGVGNVTFRRLLERFETPFNVLSASSGVLQQVKGVTGQIVTEIVSHNWRQFAEEECIRLEAAQARLVTFTSAEYPKSLFEIPDPPPVLYIRGQLAAREIAVAVVGSRRATSYGIQATFRLARELAERGVTIISGLARGVDAAAHKGALEAGGRTIGVLGCGIDLVYPPEHRELYQQVAAAGCLVSEFPMGTLPLAHNFPRRNRIISGLSRGVLVAEAAENSGSLITARCALEHGRDVYAIPGNITFAASKGTNSLIKQGAKLVDSVDDILEELPLANHQGSQRPEAALKPDFSLSPREAFVYEVLAQAPLHIDDIIARTELTAGEVSSMLLHLELKGAVMTLPGMHYAVT